MRILYRDREAWVDLSEEPEGTDHEPWEREARQGFTVALPNPPKEIEVSEGRAFYWLRQTGASPYDDKQATYFAEYVMAVPNSRSPRPK